MSYIHRERVDNMWMEYYKRKPYIRFRNISTGLYVPRPESIIIIRILGVETSGGSEPIEIELIGRKRIYIQQLEEYKEEAEKTLDEEKTRLREKLIETLRKRFGEIFEGMAFDKIVWEDPLKRKVMLTVKGEEGITIKYRHPSRTLKWKKEEIPL